MKKWRYAYISMPYLGGFILFFLKILPLEELSNSSVHVLYSGKLFFVHVDIYRWTWIVQV